jgi:hypothetical protein
VLGISHGNNPHFQRRAGIETRTNDQCGHDAYHERWPRFLYLAACVVALPAVSQFICMIKIMKLEANGLASCDTQRRTNRIPSRWSNSSNGRAVSTPALLGPRAHQRARYALPEDPAGISHWGLKGSPGGDSRGRSTPETGRRGRRPASPLWATFGLTQCSEPGFSANPVPLQPFCRDRLNRVMSRGGMSRSWTGGAARPQMLPEVSCQVSIGAGHGERVARRGADHPPALCPINKAVTAVGRGGHRDRTAFRKCAGTADGAVGKR